MLLRVESQQLDDVCDHAFGVTLQELIGPEEFSVRVAVEPAPCVRYAIPNGARMYHLQENEEGVRAV